MSNPAVCLPELVQRSLHPVCQALLIVLIGVASPPVFAQTAASQRLESQAAEPTLDEINRRTGFVPASEQDVLQVVRSIEAAVAEKDSVAFRSLFDESAYLDRCLIGVELPTDVRTEFEAGFRNSSPFKQTATHAIDLGGEYRFIRLVRTSGEIRPLFRFILPGGGGINYNELIVSRHSGRQPQIVDMMVAASGGSLSVTSRPVTLAMFADSPNSDQIRFSGVEPGILRSAKAIKAISFAFAAGKFRDAYGHFSELTPTMQGDKRLRVLKCIVGKNAGSQEYEQSLMELAEYFPDETATDLFLADLYRIQKKDDQLVHTVDRLLAELQDPYLNYLKTESLLRLNRLEEAMSAVLAAKSVAAHRSEVWVAEIEVLMKLRNHSATAKAIDALERKFGDGVLKLASYPDFNEFADSEAGRTCLARRAGFLE